MDTKLTVRVPKHLLENAKRYAREHQTTLTELVSAYLEHIPGGQQPLDGAPTVRQLSGLLSGDTGPETYKQHLVEKYDGR